MSLYISALASGSNGNCYYVGNETEAVLIDAGISCREIEKRMLGLGLSMQKVSAVFISHEHSDHICGLPVLAKKHGLPVYITRETLLFSRLKLQSAICFKECTSIQIGALSITPFQKAHDAADPFSFIVSCGDVRVGVFTDIGSPCALLKQHFSQCHAAFLESNYDEQMLQEGGYPVYLKNRIRGGKGHLSNRQALQLFQEHRPAFMSHLLLSHLSKNNNCPKLVEQLFQAHAGSTKIVVASRYEASDVFCIKAEIFSKPALQHHHHQPPQLEFAFA